MGRKGRICGRGRVFWGAPEKPTPSTAGCGVAAYLSCAREIEVLQAMAAAPDFEYGASGKEDGDHMLAYIHRSVAGMDLYFVSNQASQSRNENGIFRTVGRRPELWDAVTGEIRDLPIFQEHNGRTILPLTFAPGQSFFIVFRKTTNEEPRNETRRNFSERHTIAQLTGPWQVSFDRDGAGPKAR